MAHIEKRGKAWRVRWRDSAGAHRGRRAPTKAVAAELERTIESAHALGRDWKPESATRWPLIEALMAAYIKDRQRTCADRTWQGDVEQLDLFLRWVIAQQGQVAVTTAVLSRGLVEDYDLHLKTTGHRKPLELGSRRQVIGQVMRFWAWAWEHEDYEGLVPRPRRVKLPPAVGSAVHAPTFAQVDQVIGRLRDERERRAAVLMRCLGVRISQACRMYPEDFDLVADTWRLREELGKTANEKAGRHGPLPAALREELETWALQPGQPIVGLAPPRVRRALREAWKASGLSSSFWAKRPNHAFRKALATEARAAKCERDAIEYWCGRRPTTGVGDRYTDPRCLELVQIARSIPPLERRAQGAPMMRLLFGASRAESGLAGR